MSAFDFLDVDFPSIYDEAEKSVNAALPDPRTSCFYSRRVVEQAVRWAFNADPDLSTAYGDTVSELLNDPTFKRQMGDTVFRFAKDVVRQGNQAVHEATHITQRDSITSLSALFQFCYWFARTYGLTEKPAADLRFDPRYLPVPKKVEEASVEQVAALEQALEKERQRALDAVKDQAGLQEELDRLKAEVAEAKKIAAAAPDDHDYSEKETRDYFIDLLLAEAGWPFGKSDKPADGKDVEVKVTGMPNNEGIGYVDYVLWGDDGKPLAVVEAKKTRKDAEVGKQQAVLYADCLEAQYGQRPVIFYTNGFQHHMWDDLRYPSRAVQGFYTQDQLELLVQRRTTLLPLASVPISNTIIERPYQVRCIKNISEHFEQNHRKALVVLATGAGKTRTAIALSDLLIRANWAKRILFLADRIALVNQATNAFKAFLPDSAPVNLVTEKDTEGRVFVSTYQTMMGMINDGAGSEKRFGPGYFDLVVIDEAHRSVFKKFQAIFDYFDSFLVGLTATPKDEVNKNTYDLFDLETGVPTDAYSLEEAIEDGYLVDYEAVEMTTKFLHEGITYDELSAEEQELWDEMDWGDESDPPDAVDAAALNKWLFNADTVDQILAILMISGVMVDGGDKLGKTIIFAKNQAHASFIEERFNVNYPHLKGKCARTITYNVTYAQDLIDKFSDRNKDPQIAVSVDMLDTGIDVPEVLNLVFFKSIRSKTKFWQMLGRGTRLCPELFGPRTGLVEQDPIHKGPARDVADKQFFRVFDCCGNFEFFKQDPKMADGAIIRSINERRFIARLSLLRIVEGTDDAKLGEEVAGLLQREVSSMNLDNFVVRPHRAAVEKFRAPEAWTAIDDTDATLLTDDVAALPTELPSEPEEARRFDLMILNLQLAVLRADPGFTKLRDQVMNIASLLEEYPTIPAVHKELLLLAELQSEEWWEGVTLPMLEDVRKRLRLLVPFIEKGKQKIVYTDFTDQLGTTNTHGTGLLPPHSSFEAFRTKALSFLKEHQGESAVRKIHQNWPITSEDMAELQRILIDSGVGTTDDFNKAREQAGSFGLFIRSLVGLDRAAAQEAFGRFLAKQNYNANQINFVNLIISDLAQNGVISADRFYDAPYTGISATGPQGLFTPEQLEELDDILESVRLNAAVA